MPRRAKMKMKSTRRTSRATMEEMESTRDLTRFPMAFQYLNKMYDYDQGWVARACILTW